MSRDFALPYSKAREALDEADAADDRRFTNEMRQAQQLRKQAAKLKNIGINSSSDLLVKKTKQLSDRADSMEAAAKPYTGHNPGRPATLQDRAKVDQPRRPCCRAGP